VGRFLQGQLRRHDRTGKKGHLCYLVRKTEGAECDGSIHHQAGKRSCGERIRHGSEIKKVMSYCRSEKKVFLISGLGKGGRGGSVDAQKVPRRKKI